MTSESRKCSGVKKNGERCQAWAVKGSDPPLCSAHAGRNVGAGAPVGNQNAAVHGFYGRVMTVQELADLVSHSADETLHDEIAATRVALRRVMQQLDEEMEPGEYGRLAALIFRGAGTVARLLRANRALSGEAADGIAGAIGQALDELSSEMGVDL